MRAEPLETSAERIADELEELRRALVAVADGKHSRIVKFRTSPGTRERTALLPSAERRSVIEMRWIDRLEGGPQKWLLPSLGYLGGYVELGIESVSRWEDVVVADDAVGRMPVVPGHSFDKTNVFIARVTIFNPMDPDTYDWREIRWIGTVEKP